MRRAPRGALMETYAGAFGAFVARALNPFYPSFPRKREPGASDVRLLWPCFRGDDAGKMV
jgi:hypothetical protein